MLYKNDNLEELFKKAADDYPLKTDNPDWDSVAAKLNSSKIVAAKNVKVLKYAAVMFLLLITSSIIYNYQFKLSENRKHGVKNSVAANVQLPEIKKSTQPKNHSAIQLAGKIKNSSSENFTIITNQSRQLMPSDQNLIADNTDFKTNQQKTKDELLLAPVVKSNFANITNGSQLYLHNVQQPGISVNEINFNNVDTITSCKSAKTVIKLHPVTAKFYGVLYASPEFSTVKFQHIDNPGNKIGVALGYKINKKLSVEIGLQREHINFYTEGKYFDTSAIKLKPNTVLNDVDGKSKLTSVPLTVKYNFSSHKNAHFFAAAGVNAILVTHTERYNYSFSKNGVEGKHNRNYSWVTGPNYFTDIIASAGYETKLYRCFNIKVEPYYQIPLHNLGVGKVPVTSCGINIGIVKNLK